MSTQLLTVVTRNTCIGKKINGNIYIFSLPVLNVVDCIVKLGCLKSETTAYKETDRFNTNLKFQLEVVKCLCLTFTVQCIALDKFSSGQLEATNRIINNLAYSALSIKILHTVLFSEARGSNSSLQYQSRFVSFTPTCKLFT